MFLYVNIPTNDLMSEKYIKTCKYSNYVDHLPILASTVTGCISISSFAWLIAIPVGVTSSAVGIEISTITAGIKKCKSIIKKKKKHDKIVLLGNDKLNTIEVLISKALIDSYISHDEFVSVYNVLREFNEMREEIKNIEASVEYRTSKRWKNIVSVEKNILLAKIQVSEKLNKID